MSRRDFFFFFKEGGGRCRVPLLKKKKNLGSRHDMHASEGFIERVSSCWGKREREREAALSCTSAEMLFYFFFTCSI